MTDDLTDMTHPDELRALLEKVEGEREQALQEAAALGRADMHRMSAMHSGRSFAYDHVSRMISDLISQEGE